MCLTNTCTLVGLRILYFNRYINGINVFQLWNSLCRATVYMSHFHRIETKVRTVCSNLFRYDMLMVYAFLYVCNIRCIIKT